MDLRSHSRAQETGLNTCVKMVCVTGNTLGGQTFGGCDAIRSLPR